MTLTSALSMGFVLAEALLRGSRMALDAREMIQRLIAEGRDPSDEEWQALMALSEDLHHKIQGKIQDGQDGRSD